MKNYPTHTAHDDRTAHSHASAATASLDRRRFLTGVGAAGAAAVTMAAAGCGGDLTPTVVNAQAQSELDVLNFALNLEYLEATFYSYVVTGKDIDASLTGNGPAPTGTFAAITATPQANDLLAEILFDEVSHVASLRAVLSTYAVPRPQLNLAALAPVTSANYLQFARLFEDVGVTAYAGSSSSLTGNNNTAAAQILATEGFHAGALRLLSIQQNIAYPSSLAGFVPQDGYDVKPADPGTVALSQAGPTTSLGAFFATLGPGTGGQSNTFNGFAFRRTPSQVLAILYGSTTAGTAKGAFFSNGVNGTVKTV